MAERHAGRPGQPAGAFDSLAVAPDDLPLDYLPLDYLPLDDLPLGELPPDGLASDETDRGTSHPAIALMLTPRNQADRRS